MLLARMDAGGKGPQSLHDHTYAVAAATSSRCAKMGLRALGELAGLLHDSGKAYAVWQDYLAGKSAGMVPHAGPGVWFAKRLFQDSGEEGAALTLQMLCLVIRGHHGGLHDVLSPEGEPDEPLPLTCLPDESKQAENAFFSEIVSKERLESLFRQACGEVKFLFRTAHLLAADCAEGKKKQALNEWMAFLGLGVRFLYASLIDADRADAAAWESGGEAAEPASPDWDAHLKNLGKRLGQFERKGIGVLRGRISDACGSFASEASGVYRLYVPTGGGKTLSSVNFALHTAKRWNKDKIFVITPYLTILEQNAREIRRALGEDEDMENSAVLEHASSVVFEDDEEGEEKERRHNRQIERWRSPEIIMTSSVQFLNVMFSGKTAAARRMQALANSVIIFDEVQAIPSECTYLFNMAVSFLTQFCRCVVVLCTATQPALSELDYPVRLSSPPDIVPDAPALFHAFQRTRLVFENVLHGMEMEELSAYICRRFRENGNCLAIMNTKSIAFGLYQAVQKSVSGEAAVVYLSTELCPAHRTTVLDDVRRHLDQGKPVICISTQLIEAGVDISFQCVVRAMAGLDSIIQAAGRCNRHGGDAVKGVYIVRCAGERLNMLPDIEAGQKATRQLLLDFERDPQALGGELLSPAAISRYYGYYYGIREKTLGYALKSGHLAVNLLGYNESARVGYQNEYKKGLHSSELAQAFRTVGAGFTPIFQNTTGVVVPFGQCAGVLQRLLAASAAKDKRRYLRRLQKYTVNVYENRLKELYRDGAITFLEAWGLWTLGDSFYDARTGIRVSAADAVDRYIL